MKYALLSLLFLLYTEVSAQTEHNFEQEPQNTDCHQLPEKFDSAANAIELISKATHRYTETLKISRYRSPRKLEYYSCDGELGYVIAYIDDTEVKVFIGISADTWNTLINSDDPINSYQLIEQNHESIN